MTIGTHTQCLLEFDTDIVVIKQTAWIPSYAAAVGNMVELKEDHKFWRVAATYDVLPDEAIREIDKNYRTHRKATDI